MNYGKRERSYTDSEGHPSTRSKRRPLAFVAGLLLFPLLPLSSFATDTSPDITFVSSLEYEVASTDEWMVVGAPWHDDFRGAAYVMHRSGNAWEVVQRLSPSDLGNHDHFGSAVEIRRNEILASASWQEMLRGATYRFQLTDGEWHETAKLPGQLSSSGSTQLVESDLLRTVGSLIDRLTETPAPWPTAHRLPAPVESVIATDGQFETRTEITWSGTGQDAVIYKVLRDGILLSVASSDDSRYVDTTGDPGTVYDYCVVVKDMLGNESSPVCDSGSRILFPPTPVTASDGQYTDRVDIRWQDRSLINDGYVVYRDSLGIMTVVDSLGPNDKQVDDFGAAVSFEYDYHVQAYVDEGFTSTAETDAGFRGAVLPPSIVSASDGQFIDHVAITWTPQAPDTNAYNVYRDGALLDSILTNSPSYDDFTAAFDSVYVYCVTTRGAGGAESIPVCDEGSISLEAPTGVAASDSTYDDRIRIEWTDVSHYEDAYEVSRGSGPGSVTVLDTTSSNRKSYDDFTADPNVDYYYEVRAVRIDGGISTAGSDHGYRSYVLAPFNVRASDGDVEDHVEIEWESLSATAVLFSIFRDSTFIKSVSANQTSYADYQGVAGQEYQYSVRAMTAHEVEAAGPSDPGRRDLLAPATVAATDDAFEDLVEITWTPTSTAADGYHVYREYPAGGWVPIGGLGNVALPGVGMDVAVSDGLVYVGTLGYGLRVYDVSDPAAPVLLSTYADGTDVKAVIADGSTVYTTGEDGLNVLDMADPNNPALVGNFPAAGSSTGLWVSGNVVYLADYKTITAVDVTNGASPVSLGSLTLPGTSSIIRLFETGATLYVGRAGVDQGLSILDVSNPSTPTLVGTDRGVGSMASPSRTHRLCREHFHLRGRECR
ncbi:MAG: hypothetical protein R3E12_11305 [Candidatus Eisenbacteria bacterium]